MVLISLIPNLISEFHHHIRFLRYLIPKFKITEFFPLFGHYNNPNSHLFINSVCYNPADSENLENYPGRTNFEKVDILGLFHTFLMVLVVLIPNLTSEFLYHIIILRYRSQNWKAAIFRYNSANSLYLKTLFLWEK